MRKLILFTTFISLLVGCSSLGDDNNKPTIYVTITPLKAFAEELTMGDFNVEVLVPNGASPESFEPTAKQITALKEATLVFNIGLINFEQSLLRSNDKHYIDLSRGIDLLEGSCSHTHSTTCNHGHTHGVDPHIWTSPRALRQMVESMREAVMQIYPDSAKYNTAAANITKRLRFLDRYCSERLGQADVKAMAIYHPAYTYYANDYHITQIAIEQDGKEPTPKQLTSLINTLRRLGIKHILIQPQYNTDRIKSIAKECGATIVTTDPLCEDIESEIHRITELIASSHER